MSDFIFGVTAEESVHEVKKRAEDAVADVKRTAVVELQKAVTTAEGRHKEAMAALQAQMDNGIAEARRQAAEEAFELANQQEDSTEVRHQMVYNVLS